MNNIMQEKLLIIHQGALGDIVSIFPAIVRLREKFCRIDIICKKSIGELASFLNLTDKFYSVDAAFFSSIYSEKADPVAAEILHSYDEILLFSYSQELERGIRGIFQKNIHRIPPRPCAHSDIHILNHILKYLAESRLIHDPAPPGNDYYALPAEHEETDSQYDGTTIILHPGSGSMRKNWPVSNFIATFEMLGTAGMHPEIILGPAEQSLFEICAKNLNTDSRIHMISDLFTLMRILKQSGGFIGNDSGVSHLAGFLGIPAVVIFGPSNPKRWKPFGPSVEVLRTETDCKPCFETGKADCREMKCLEGTTPDMVINALFKIYRK